MRRGLAILIATAVILMGDVVMASEVTSIRLPVTMPAEVDETTVIVEPGDHLWKMSAEHLSLVGSAQPVAPYWIQVIAVNRDELRSGDPDLIYPGETIRLPQP